jgi:hypothetical protein
MNSQNVAMLLLFNIVCSYSLVFAYNIGREPYLSSPQTEADMSYYQVLAKMKPPKYLTPAQQLEFTRRMQNILDRLQLYFTLKKKCLQNDDCELNLREN